MQTAVEKDPYQLVCQAFERGELRELLLGENGYGYKMNPRNDWTSPEEKTDCLVIYPNLIEYYLANNKDQTISQKITEVLMRIPETHWGIYVVSNMITLDADRKKNQPHSLNLDLDRIANHLKKIIQSNRAALMQEKLYGGLSFDQGMYQYLNRVSAGCVGDGGPAFVEDNANANDPFEATTTFTLTLPGKLGDLSKQLHNTFMGRATTILKGSPIFQDNGYVASKDSTWTFTLERQKQPTGETQFICMVNNIYAFKTKLLNAIQQFDLNTIINSTIWLENPNQQVTIPTTALQKISEMNIPFSIDIQLKTTDKNL